MFSRQPKYARPTSFRCQHPGHAPHPVPAGARQTAAAPARERIIFATRTRLARTTRLHARTPRSRASLASNRFPPTRPGVARAVRARPGGPTRLTKDAAVLAVRRITQSWPMIAAHTARPSHALDASPLNMAPPPPRPHLFSPTRTPSDSRSGSLFSLFSASSFWRVWSSALACVCACANARLRAGNRNSATTFPMRSHHRPHMSPPFKSRWQLPCTGPMASPHGKPHDHIPKKYEA